MRHDTRPISPTRHRRLGTCAAVLAVGALAALGLPATANAQPLAPAVPPGLLADNAGRQIAALQSVKRATMNNPKLDGRLATELALRHDPNLARTLPRASTGLRLSPRGTITVDLRADRVSDELLASVRRAGGVVRSVSTRSGTVHAEVPLTAVTGLAGLAGVQQVAPASEAMLADATLPEGTSLAPGSKLGDIAPDGALTSSKVPTESKDQKAARIAAAIASATASAAAAAPGPQGTVVSEGDKAHAADAARQSTHVTGVGVKLCALSDGVDSLAGAQAAGELPSTVDVVAGQEGNGDEGTAMLEILHDLAPGASLGFATAFNGEQSFADNIRALRFDKHCTVIVDDVLYFDESPFQDGPPAQAVNDITADGGFYFSSAGNDGNTRDGTAAHWEGDFTDSGQGIAKFVGTATDFDPGPGTQIFEPISDFSAGAPVNLFWSDPAGAATDDYDLYLLDSQGNVVAFSQDVQNGTQNPYERTDVPGGTGLKLAIVKFSGQNRYLSVDALRGRFAAGNGLTAFTTPGVSRGHSTARAAYGVAATPAAGPLPFALEPGDPANPSGPFPNAFGPGAASERFSSDGPRRMFFQADGTPITPGNFGSTGGEVRQKPDITAADGVRTAVNGFSPFFGTSAAAPHAAAIAGLVLSGNPGLSAADLRDAINSTALDLLSPGTDEVTGHGLVMADRLLGFTGASPQPLARAEKPVVQPAGDGDQFLEPGESATVLLPVHNVGDGTAVSVSTTLTTTTAGATISPRAQSYGTIEAGATGLQSYTLTLAPDFPVGQAVALTAKVTFAGVLSPTTAGFSQTTGQPGPARSFSYTGPPVPIPDASTVGASASVTVSGVGTPASALSFSIDGSNCAAGQPAANAGLDHTFLGDLTGVLTGPNGQSATLFQRNGSSGDNLCQVVFDDTAARPFGSVVAGDAPFTGTWRPATPLAPLGTSPVDGVWTLHVVDGAGLDTGSIRAFTVHVAGFVSSPAA